MLDREQSLAFYCHCMRSEMTEHHKKTVICVDDEQRILNSLKMLLKRNFNVLVTTDGNEAIQLLKKEKAHVIICDQRMPKITGIEVLKQANRVSPNTMRILLTGYSDLAAVVGSINDGEIYRFINKPWENSYIKQQILNAASISDGLWIEAQQLNAKLNSPETAAPLAGNLPVTGILVLDQDPALGVVDIQFV